MLSLWGGLAASVASIGSRGDREKKHAASHRVEGDTSCMKAHVVKGNVFVVVFS